MKFISIFLLFIFSFPAFAEEIKYEIYETPTEKLIASGSKQYSVNDIILNTYESRKGPVVEKFIELEQGYKIGARIFQDNRLTGFGLLAQLTDVDFSWEWYNKKEGNLFQKLQGKNYVEVKTSGLPLIEILEEVKFLDDTKLRFSLGGPGNDDSHHIIVKKGSVLKFN